MSDADAAKSEHMLTINKKVLTSVGPVSKLHWFSNLSDALKRSNIDND